MVKTDSSNLESDVMRKELTTFRKNGIGEDDESIVVSVILLEGEEGLELTIRKQVSSVKQREISKTVSEEELALSRVDPEKIGRFALLTDHFLESESKSTFFETIGDLDGTYKQPTSDTSNQFPKSPPETPEIDIDSLVISVGEYRISVESTEDESVGIDIPTGEVIEEAVPQDFENVLLLNRIFFDFFDKRYDGELEIFQSDEPVEIEQTAVDKIEQIFERFNEIALPLQERRGDRRPIKMTDEYDVQYILHALLKLHFSDVRDESYLRQHAGISPRIDFLVWEEDIGIEVKRPSTSRDSEKIRTELSEDKEQYRSDRKCDTLLIFIYDPERTITNPTEFENDLTEETQNLTTRVRVTQ